MHMILVMLAGSLLLVVFALFGKLWGGDAASIALGAQCFLPAWLLLCLANLWVGVNKAGYTVAQELPILLANFAVPTALAMALLWWLSKS